MTCKKKIKIGKKPNINILKPNVYENIDLKKKIPSHQGNDGRFKLYENNTIEMYKINKNYENYKHILFLQNNKIKDNIKIDYIEKNDIIEINNMKKNIFSGKILDDWNELFTNN
jgi:hypothetical protein